MGDACDPDKDGDGVVDTFDCRPTNRFLALDRDGDTVCDEYQGTLDPGTSRLLCEYDCWLSAVYYSSPDMEQPCVTKCNNLDNCMEANSPFCDYIAQCVQVEALQSPAACLAPYCTYYGPELPASDPHYSETRACVPHTADCAAVFRNVFQENTDGQGPGDKCEPEPFVKDLRFIAPVLFAQMGVCVYGEPYRIGFRPVGGNAVVANEPVPPGELPQLDLQPEVRDAANIGACVCGLVPDFNPGGEWPPECDNSDRCNASGEENTFTHGLAWNPINTPEINVETNQGPVYPVHDSPDATTIWDLSLAYDRRLEFTRQETYHPYTWMASLAVIFGGIWPPAGTLFSDNINKTRIRVTWPNFADRDDPCHGTESDCVSEVAYSRVGPQYQQCSTSGREPLIMSDVLQRELVIFAIPGVMNGPGDPRPVNRPGYFLGYGPDTGAMHMYGLGTDVPLVDSVWEVQADAMFTPHGGVQADSGPADAALLGPAAGRRAAVFLYQPAEEKLGLYDSRFYIGVEEEGATMNLRSTEELWGASAPEGGARVVYVWDRQEVLLFGSVESSAAQDRVWRLRLSDGSWSAPARLNLPGGLSGYSANYDPVTGKVFLFGGRATEPGGTDSDSVYTVDPWTLAVTPFPVETPPAQGLARRAAGTYLDPLERALYVYGGESAIGPLEERDLWRLDLAARTWSLVLEVDKDDGPPMPMARPFVYRDRKRRTVWIAGLVGSDTSAGVDMWGLDEAGHWHKATAFKLRPAESWPVEDLFVPGRTHTYLWQDVGVADWPGRVVLATLDTDAPALGVSVRSGSGDLLVRSEEAWDGRQEAGFICPAAEACYLTVEAPGGGQYSEWTPFVLNAAPASLVPEIMVAVGGKTEDVELRGDVVFAAGRQGLQALRMGPALTLLSSATGFGMKGITGLELCGDKLCASRLRARGLKVIDVSDPSQPHGVGDAFTLIPGWDLAVRGTRAYVAHNVMGVGVYDLADPGDPVRVDEIVPGGHVITVAVQGSLLAAGTKHGTVHLYDLLQGPAIAGEVEAGGKIARVRFVGGHLWVLAKHADRVEVFDVSDPASPASLGGFTQDAADIFRARLRGARAYTFDDGNLKVYGIRALP